MNAHVLESLTPYTIADWDGENAAPAPDGSVGLLWEGANLYAYVDFRADGRTHYYTRTQNGTEEDIAGTEEACRAIRNALHVSYANH